MDICLDDIRVKLAELEDKEISLNVLDYLNNQERLNKEREDEIRKLTEANGRLLQQNAVLYTRAVASNVQPMPDNSIDEEAIINHFRDSAKI